MENRRWFNNTQPQTLQIAVILLYINAAFTLIFGGIGSLLYLPLLVVLVGQVVGAFGIANERKWGYYLAVAVAIAPIAYEAYLLLRYGVSTALGAGVLTIIFQVALIALLLHRQSRDYQRIWFK